MPSTTWAWTGCSTCSRKNNGVRDRTPLFGAPRQREVDVSGLAHGRLVVLLLRLEVLRLVPPGGAGLRLLLDDLRILREQVADELGRFGYVHGSPTKHLFYGILSQIIA